MLHPTDRLSPIPSRLPGSSDFSQFLFNLSLTELPSAGPHFTWTNNRQAQSCTFERLDRGFINGDWSSLGLVTSITNLPIHGSDHSPILLYTSLPGSIHRRQFKFEKFWTSYAGCSDIVQQSWSTAFQGSPLFQTVQKLRLTRTNLIAWVTNGMGNLASRITDTRSQLLACQLALPHHLNFDQEAVLRATLEDLLSQEEIYWSQRSKTWFLALGDKNTTFFHCASRIRS